MPSRYGESVPLPGRKITESSLILDIIFPENSFISGRKIPEQSFIFFCRNTPNVSAIHLLFFLLLEIKVLISFSLLVNRNFSEFFLKSFVLEKIPVAVFSRKGPASRAARFRVTFLASGGKSFSQERAFFVEGDFVHHPLPVVMMRRPLKTDHKRRPAFRGDTDRFS